MNINKENTYIVRLKGPEVLWRIDKEDLKEYGYKEWRLLL